jgi:hypothetical protein
MAAWLGIGISPSPREFFIARLQVELAFPEFDRFYGLPVGRLADWIEPQPTEVGHARAVEGAGLGFLLQVPCSDH